MAKPSAARTNLIDAAIDLFRNRGYAGVGVAELLEASGAPRGSLYFHFPGGKEQVGVEAVERVGGAVSQQFRDLNESGVDLNTFIDRVFKATAYGVKSRDYKGSCPIAAIAAEMSNENPKLSAAVRTVFSSWESEIAAAMVARGMSAENSVDFASAMLSSIEGAMVISKAKESTAPHVNAARAMKALAATMV